MIALPPPAATVLAPLAARAVVGRAVPWLLAASVMGHLAQYAALQQAQAGRARAGKAVQECAADAARKGEDQARADAGASESFRATERTQAAAAARIDHEQLTTQARRRAADAAGLRLAGRELRNASAASIRATAATLGRRPAAASPAAAGRRASAEAVAAMHADVLGRCATALARLAVEADAARDAGFACERYVDEVIQPIKPIVDIELPAAVDVDLPAVVDIDLSD